MRPLFLPDGPLATRFCLVVTCSLTLALTPSYAERPAEVTERELLRGLSGVEVLVEPFSLDFEEGGLQTMTLQNDIRQRLQRAGVKVFTERERLSAQAGALLVVRLDAVHDRSGRYFYSIDLLLKQRVRSGGHDAPELSAATWMKSGGIGIVADDNVKYVEDRVRRKVDEFIKDYQAVNLDRRGSDQLKSP
ncbi:MAG: hypothetical protein K8R65_11095 [Nitrospirae bacterium]|nr:hypothetical protein [Nitrospirota bacterium]